MSRQTPPPVLGEFEQIVMLALLRLGPDAYGAAVFGRLRSLLEELAPGDREILTLRYALDYDANAIAERLEIATSAVHMRLSRARQRLADRLAALGDVAPTFV